MSKAIGIDLGTTNSAAALKGLAVEIIVNSEGDSLTPSVVSCQTPTSEIESKTKYIVGKHALDWMAQDPYNTILSIKRLMGRNITDQEVQKLIKENRFAFTLKPLSKGSKHSIAVVLGDKEFTPEQISAKILQKIKADSEKRLNGKIEYAVVTVPAYFNDKQKHATRMAAALAGLKVQRLLPEPTAAAISFGVETLSSGEAATILVFDLGGGTFDIAVLTIVDGQFIEQGKGGDMWMGGDDIDSLITQYVYHQTEQENDIEQLGPLIEKLPASDKNRFLSDLKRKVESAKIKLSSQQHAAIEILGLLKDSDGDILDIDVELSRDQLETLLLPFVERTIELTRQVLKDINFDLDLIDKVVMVGGSSAIPLVVRKMQVLFGEQRVLVHPKPMLAVAEGAGILAHRLSESYECPACGQEVAQADNSCNGCQFDLNANLVKTGVVDIVHTVSHDYFLAMEGGSDYPLVQQNTHLPFKTQSAFKLLNKEQRLAHFKFYNSVNHRKESIGDLWLSFDSSKTDIDEAQIQEVLLDFEIDESNLISVQASLKQQPDIKVSKTLSRGNVDEKLLIDLEESIAQVNGEKHEYFVKYDFLQRAISIAALINQVVDTDTGEADDAICQKVVHQQAIAKQLVAKDITILSNLYYAEDLVARYGGFLNSQQRKSMDKKIAAARKASDYGELEDMIKKRDKMLDEMDKYPGLMAIKDLEHVCFIVGATDPAKVPHFEQYLHDINDALDRNDVTAFGRLMKEIGPEIDQVLKKNGARELRIWEGISQ